MLCSHMGTYQNFLLKINNIILEKVFVFVNVGPDLPNKIEADTGESATSYIDKRNTSSIFNTPTSNDEIFKIFSKLKDCSPGWDGMRKIIFNSILNIIANACPSYKFIFQARHIVPIEQKIAQRDWPRLKSSKNRWFYFGFLIWPYDVSMYID